MNRKLTTAVGAVASLAVLSGCGKAPVYRPSAFGENGSCYYVDSVEEVYALQRAGLCQSGWGAQHAPDSWLYRYGSYYGSPSYVNSYVPQQRRQVVIVQERDFLNAHKADVKRESAKATYVTVKKNGTVGKTVTGNKLPKAVKAGKFGGGDRKISSGGGDRNVCCKSTSGKSESRTSGLSSSSVSKPRPVSRPASRPSSTKR